MKFKSFISTVLIVITINSLSAYFKDKIIFNYTFSIPFGLYKVEKNINSLEIGDIVTFNIKKYPIIYNRIHEDITFSKYICAKYNDVVENRNGCIYINDIFKGEILKEDSEGKPISSILKRKTILKKDELFLMGSSKNSFDSRYYGAIKKKDIIYKLKPLLIFNGGVLNEKEK